jgi:hypothetical protein
LKKQSQFAAGQMNVSFFSTKDYENNHAFRLRENEAKQSQFQDTGSDVDVDSRWSLSRTRMRGGNDKYGILVRRIKSFENSSRGCTLSDCNIGNLRINLGVILRAAKNLWIQGTYSSAPHRDGKMAFEMRLWLS